MMCPAPQRLPESRLIAGSSLDRAESHAVASGVLQAYTHASPIREDPADNQDALLIVPVDRSRCILAIADGVGGHWAGAEAARVALHELAKSITSSPAEDDPELRTRIISGVEAGNAAVLELGGRAGTTISIVEIDGLSARPYHVGDSDIICMGQRGVIRFQTVAHSPIAYAVEAGLIDPDHALHHADRHIISNVVGDPDMRIDVGPLVRLRARDTVLLGSDGLFDNLYLDEIITTARCGPAGRAARRLIEQTDRRMTTRESGQPRKPDDLTFMLYRPTA